MSEIVNDIIRDAVSLGLSLPRDPIQDELLQTGLTAYNHYGRAVWAKWPFDNEKLDAFEIDSDADGIITFATTVAEIRSIRLKDEATGVAAVAVSGRIFNQDELLAEAQGEEITEDRFQYLADDPTTRARRVKVRNAMRSGAMRSTARCSSRRSSSVAVLPVPGGPK
jgi:hypothetical protein